jgi:hypothetical protein
MVLIQPKIKPICKSIQNEKMGQKNKRISKNKWPKPKKWPISLVFAEEMAD